MTDYHQVSCVITDMPCEYKNECANCQVKKDHGSKIIHLLIDPHGTGCGIPLIIDGKLNTDINADRDWTSCSCEKCKKSAAYKKATKKGY